MTRKVIVVTGASSGIGLAVAKHLIKELHSVIVMARRSAPLEELKATYPTQVDYIAADLTDYSVAPSVTQLALDRFGRLDGIVISHGVLSPMTRLEDSEIENWVRHYEVNVFSGVALVKPAIPELRKTRGCVVWVSSGAAFKPYVSWGAYGSSKAALHSVATHLAAEEPEICSIGIQPGRVDTDMQREARDLGKLVMRPDQYEGFADAFHDGALVSAEDAGSVLARVVVASKLELSGTNIRFGAPELNQFQTF